MPLTAANLTDLLAFFEGPAFADNLKWASCCCAYNYLDHNVVKWADRGGGENRATLCALVEAGTARGWLAYRDGAVVGWLNAAPRSHYPAYACHDGNDASAGALTCFVNSPSARRQGIASALLAAACAGFAEQGCATIEAWPKRNAHDAASQYHGPLDMYLANGFVVVRDAPESPLIQVRRTL